MLLLSKLWSESARLRQEKLLVLYSVTSDWEDFTHIRRVDAGVPVSQHRKWYELVEVYFNTESGTGHWKVENFVGQQLRDVAS